MTDSLPKSEGSLPIGYELSPRARAYFDARPEKRDPKYTCSEAELIGLLEKYGLPVSRAILDFERNFGGWSLPAPRDEWMTFGICALLRSNSPASLTFRRFDELFAAPHTDEGADDEDDPIPLFGTGYPRAFFETRPLLPAGIWGRDNLYFLDPEGVVYLYTPPLNELTIRGGSGRTWLEWLALSVELPHPAPGTSRIVLFDDFGASLGASLGLAPVPEASDQIRHVWASSTTRIEVDREHSPNQLATRVISRDPNRIVSSVRLARATSPSCRIETERETALLGDLDELLLHGQIHRIPRSAEP